MAPMRKVVFFALASLITCFLGLYAVGRPQAALQPDAIFYNGHIVTMNAVAPTAQALAVSNGRFVAVGSSNAIERMAGPNTRRVDLHGRTVVPGLADDHFHSIGGGRGVDLSRTRSIDDVLNAIGERVRRTPPGEVIITNSDWHEGQLKEQRLPYRYDLDR